MTADVRALFRSGIVALVGLGVGAVFLILGVAAVALQAQCASGAIALGACPQDVAVIAPIEPGSAEPELSAKDVAVAEAPAPQAELAQPSPRDRALTAAGQLIAGTFDALVEDTGSDDAAPSEAEVTAVADVGSAAVEAGGAREDAASPPLALAKRTVTSVPVSLDGQPVWTASRDPEARSAAADAARDVAAVPTPDIEPLAFAASPPRPFPKPAELTPAPAAPSDPVQASGKATIASAVNVRAGPSGDHKRLFVLAAGSEVDATHAEKGWVRVVDARGREGWAYSDFLDNVDLDALPAPEAGDVAVASAVAVTPPASSGDVRTVKGQGVNVRSGPSSSSGKMFALRGGTKVTVTDTNRGWLKITDPNGRTGWAYQQYLSGS